MSSEQEVTIKIPKSEHEDMKKLKNPWVNDGDNQPSQIAKNDVKQL